jgi:hypothetical protein
MQIILQRQLVQATCQLQYAPADSFHLESCNCLFAPSLVALVSSLDGRAALLLHTFAIRYWLNVLPKRTVAEPVYSPIKCWKMCCSSSQAAGSIAAQPCCAIAYSSARLCSCQPLGTCREQAAALQAACCHCRRHFTTLMILCSSLRPLQLCWLHTCQCCNF